MLQNGTRFILLDTFGHHVDDVVHNLKQREFIGYPVQANKVPHFICTALTEALNSKSK
jgi:hypothetical protein